MREQCAGCSTSRSDKRAMFVEGSSQMFVPRRGSVDLYASDERCAAGRHPGSCGIVLIVRGCVCTIPGCTVGSVDGTCGASRVAAQSFQFALLGRCAGYLIGDAGLGPHTPCVLANGQGGILPRPRASHSRPLALHAPSSFFRDASPAGPGRCSVLFRETTHNHIRAVGALSPPMFELRVSDGCVL